ncbi:MAG: UpxY family transcription antiterminator [Bacteroidetes bacterium]|nr:UpxY family transcription antiterminator [Bacteroidota bacterium]
MNTIAQNKNEIKNWFALYVSSRAEKKVMESLLTKGIQAYAPLVKTVRNWSDRKKTVELPLLNGYVFVYISDFRNGTYNANKRCC